MESILKVQLNQESQEQKYSLFKDIKTGEETLLSGGVYENISSPVALSPSPQRPPKPEEQIVAVGPNGLVFKLSDLIKYLDSMGLVPRG